MQRGLPLFQRNILPIFQGLIGSTLAHILFLAWPSIGMVLASTAYVMIAFVDELALYKWIGPVLMSVGWLIFGAYYIMLNNRIAKLVEVRQGKSRAVEPDDRSAVGKFGDLHRLILLAKAERRARGLEMDYRTNRMEIELFAELEELGISRPLGTTNAALAEYWEILAFLSEEATPASLNEARKMT